MEKLLNIQRKIFQQRGGRPDWNLTSPLQQQHARALAEQGPAGIRGKRGDPAALAQGLDLAEHDLDRRGQLWQQDQGAATDLAVAAGGGACKARLLD